MSSYLFLNLVGVWLFYWERDTAISVAQRFLDKLDLGLIFDRRERWKGKQVIIYKGCHVNADQRGEIFERWLKRDEANSMNEAA